MQGEEDIESSAASTSELTQPAQDSIDGENREIASSMEQGRDNDDIIELGEEQGNDDITEPGEGRGNDDVIELGEGQGNDNVATPSQEGVASSDSTDQAAGSIMLAESNLSIDMTYVARATSSDKLGSPVLPTTALEEVAITTEEQQRENSSSSLLTTNKSPEKEAESITEAPPTIVAEDLVRVEEELEGVHLTPSISDSVPDVTIDLEEGVEEGVEPVFMEEEGEAPM